MKFAAVLCVALALGAVANAQSSGGDAGVRELNAVPFESIIGGPLIAVVQAQAQAAKTSIAFINDIGYDASSNGAKTPRMIHFDYNSVSSSGATVQGRMNVPILAMIPIPFLRFESVEVEFNVKITEATEADSTTTGNSRSNFKDMDEAIDTQAAQITTSATVSHTSTKDNQKESREYSTRVLVRASQADVPEGMGKILDKLLELSLSMAKQSS